MSQLVIAGLPALESQLTDICKKMDALYALATSLENQQMLTQEIALEADGLVTNSTVLRHYYSSESRVQKYKLAMESLSANVIALIVAGIGVLVAIVGKILGWFNGAFGGGGGGGSGGGHATLNPERIEEKKELLEDIKRAVDAQAHQSEFRKYTFDDGFNEMKKGGNDHALPEVHEPAVFDMLSSGPYTRAVAKMGAFLIQHQPAISLVNLTKELDSLSTNTTITEALKSILQTVSPEDYPSKEAYTRAVGDLAAKTVTEIVDDIINRYFSADKLTTMVNLLDEIRNEYDKVKPDNSHIRQLHLSQLVTQLHDAYAHSGCEKVAKDFESVKDTFKEILEGLSAAEEDIKSGKAFKDPEDGPKGDDELARQIRLELQMQKDLLTRFFREFHTRATTTARAYQQMDVCGRRLDSAGQWVGKVVMDSLKTAKDIMKNDGKDELAKSKEWKEQEETIYGLLNQKSALDGLPHVLVL